MGWSKQTPNGPSAADPLNRSAPNLPNAPALQPDGRCCRCVWTSRWHSPADRLKPRRWQRCCRRRPWRSPAPCPAPAASIDDRHAGLCRESTHNRSSSGPAGTRAWCSMSAVATQSELCCRRPPNANKSAVIPSQPLVLPSDQGTWVAAFLTCFPFRIDTSAPAAGPLDPRRPPQTPWPVCCKGDGASGSGKTVVRCCGRLLTPYRGGCLGGAADAPT